MKGEELDLDEIEKRVESNLFVFKFYLLSILGIFIIQYFFKLYSDINIYIIILLIFSMITIISFLDYRYYCTKYYMLKYFKWRKP